MLVCIPCKQMDLIVLLWRAMSLEFDNQLGMHLSF